MSTQKIELGFDKDDAWCRANGRQSVFLDTNCWIEMADEANETACRVKHRLKSLVAAGQVICPLSWGILEELFKQSGDSLTITSSLMEELSLNVIFIMRQELFKWEFDRSIRSSLGERVDKSLDGLFAPPAAFVGSQLQLSWTAEAQLTPAAQQTATDHLRRALSEIGIAELAEKMGGTNLDETPPAYSAAAKDVRERFKGDKKKLFLEEAGNCFFMYITPLFRNYPPQVIASWSAQFGPADNEETWFLNALGELPALHNFIDAMIVADSQPDRKDNYNHFMDNEIMAAPLAYADAFASRDRGIRDMLRYRTKILSRTACHYCDSLDELETWLTGHLG